MKTNISRRSDNVLTESPLSSNGSGSSGSEGPSKDEQLGTADAKYSHKEEMPYLGAHNDNLSDTHTGSPVTLALPGTDQGQSLAFSLASIHPF